MPNRSLPLILVQVVTWILDRNFEQIQRIPPDGLYLEDVEKLYARKCVRRALRFYTSSETADFSGLSNLDIKSAPIRNKNMLKYLTERGAGLNQLRPNDIYRFALKLFAALRKWHRLRGHSMIKATDLAMHAFEELDEWLESNDIHVGLVDIAVHKCVAVGNAQSAAEQKYGNALSELHSALVRDSIHAIGRRNGIGDPELLPAHFWRLLVFETRLTEQRGRVSGAGYAGEPIGYWSDLTFDSREIFADWRAELRRAPDAITRQVIQDTYDTAQAAGDKSPNIRELPNLVLPALERLGYTTSKLQIETIGAEFKSRRRPPGRTWRADQRRK